MNSAQRGFSLLLILVTIGGLIAVGAAGYLIASNKLSPQPKPSPEASLNPSPSVIAAVSTPTPTAGTGCTDELKICPDKSTVGRIAPNCQFAPCPSVTPSRVPLASVQPKSVTIPSDWTKHTASDSEFGFTTSLYLPPGYKFEFTGSEFYLGSPSEIWDYKTSVGDIKKNFYTGGSRREWYSNYLYSGFNQIEGNVDAALGKLISATEHPITDTLSYLECIVEVGYGDSKRQEKHYLYLQNNILHIISPVSEGASSPNAKLPGYMPIIFYSLKSAIN